MGEQVGEVDPQHAELVDAQEPEPRLETVNQLPEPDGQACAGTAHAELPFNPGVAEHPEVIAAFLRSVGQNDSD